MIKFVKLKKVMPNGDVARVIGENIGWNGRKVYHLVFYGYSRLEFWFADDCEDYTPSEFMQGQLSAWWDSVKNNLK